MARPVEGARPLTGPGSPGSPPYPPTESLLPEVQRAQDRPVRLSALHRAGPDGVLNQGVPVAAILADLEQQGLRDEVAVE